MKFYRVHLYGDTGVSFGYEWFTSRKEAEQRKRELDDERSDSDKADGMDEAEITEHLIEPTKAGILAALNRLANHPNNG